MQRALTNRIMSVNRMRFGSQSHVISIKLSVCVSGEAPALALVLVGLNEPRDWDPTLDQFLHVNLRSFKQLFHILIFWLLMVSAQQPVRAQWQ